MSVLSKMAGAAIRLDNCKKEFSEIEEFDEHIKKVAIKNEEEYRLIMPLKSSVKTFDFKGMKCYELKKRGSNSTDVVLYVHGGAYINRLTAFHWWFLDDVAQKTGAMIIVPIYPLAPVHRFNEANELLLALYDEIKRLYRQSRVLLMGDSAGGGFVLSLALQIAKTDQLPPDHVVMMSPWLDVSMENTDMCSLEDLDPMLGIVGLKKAGVIWAGDVDVKSPLVSPMFGDLKSLPPMTLFVGTHEIFLPDARRFKQLAAAAGANLKYVECEEVHHCYPIMPIPEGRDARKRIYSIIMGKHVKK